MTADGSFQPKGQGLGLPLSGGRRARLGRIAALGVVLLAVPVVALGQGGPIVHFTGVPARGAELAVRWCAGCHETDGRDANQPGPPAFAKLARRLPTNEDVLAGLIANPHPPMPVLPISRQDIDDLLAYIGTMR